MTDSRVIIVKRDDKTQKSLNRFQRLKPSIAEPIIRQNHQIVSNNIFTKPKLRESKLETQQNLQSKESKRPISVLFDQFPFSIPRLVGSAIAIGSSLSNPSVSSQMDDHQHQHHHHHHQPGMVHSTMESSESIRRCSMNMIFNTRPIGTCIVFRQFYVSGTTALISYLILLFLLAVGYEYLRLATSRFDKVTAIKLSLRPSPIGNGRRASPSSSSGVANRILSSPTNSIENLNDYNPKIKALGWGKVCVPRDIQLTRSLFYVTNVAISFFLMLVVMTYNAQIIAAVLAGAFVGHFLFHRELTFEDSDKGMACH